MTIADDKIVTYANPMLPGSETSGPFRTFKTVWQPKGFQLTGKSASLDIDDQGVTPQTAPVEPPPPEVEPPAAKPPRQAPPA